jgi:hypothetical protein
MILPTLLAFTFTVGPSGGGLGGGSAPLLLCPNGYAAQSCPTAGAPLPPAWLGVGSLIYCSRQIRRRIRDARR